MPTHDGPAGGAPWDGLKPVLGVAAALAFAALAKGLQTLQGAPPSGDAAADASGDVLDQAQIGSIGLVSVNIGGDQDFIDDTSGDATDPASAPRQRASGKPDRGGFADPPGPTADAVAPDDASGSDVLDQAQVGSVGLLSINLGGRQRLQDDSGAGADLDAQIAALRAEVDDLTRRVDGLQGARGTARKAATKKSASKKPVKKPVKKSATKKPTTKKPAAKKPATRKSAAKKSTRAPRARRSDDD